MLQEYLLKISLKWLSLFFIQSYGFCGIHASIAIVADTYTAVSPLELCPFLLNFSSMIQDSLALFAHRNCVRVGLLLKRVH